MKKLLAILMLLSVLSQINAQEHKEYYNNGQLKLDTSQTVMYVNELKKKIL
jgi:hypothetical protein